MTRVDYSEDALQGALIDTAHLNGWKVAHFRKARTKKGWRTPVAADGMGWPDLCLVHPERKRIIWIECKSATGSLTPEQKMWREWLISAGAEYYLCKPKNRDEIEKVLTFSE